jgi:hypothetical protein
LYPYRRFERSVMKGDHTFAPGSPGGGDALPPFHLSTTGGGWIRRDDFANHKLLIVFGSIT